MSPLFMTPRQTYYRVKFKLMSAEALLYGSGNSRSKWSICLCKGSAHRFFFARGSIEWRILECQLGGRHV